MKPKLQAIKRPHIVSIRLSVDELEELNRLVNKTGISASEIFRYGAMHHVHRELKKE